MIKCFVIYVCIYSDRVSRFIMGTVFITHFKLLFKAIFSPYSRGARSSLLYFLLNFSLPFSEYITLLLNDSYRTVHICGNVYFMQK